MEAERSSKLNHCWLDGQGRPQPEYRANLTVAVVDPQALWSAAAAKLLSAPGMTFSDALDVIGPREDPSIAECIATLAKPIALPGCVMDDFWIDGLGRCPPRLDIVHPAPEYRSNSLDGAGNPLLRAPSHLALCLSPPAQHGTKIMCDLSATTASPVMPTQVVGHLKPPAAAAASVPRPAGPKNARHKVGHDPRQPSLPSAANIAAANANGADADADAQRPSQKGPML